MIGVSGVLRTALIGLTLCCAALGWALVQRVADEQPQLVRLQDITVTPDEGRPVLLGRAALAQPKGGATAEHHLAIEQTDGVIWAYDIAPERRVGFITTQGRYAETSRIAIPQGNTILTIGDVRWQATLTGSTLVLNSSETEIILTPKGLKMRKDGQVHVRDLPFANRAGAVLRGYFSAYDIGGGADPMQIQQAVNSRRIVDERLPRNAARLVLGGGAYHLTRGRQSATWSLQSGALPASVTRPDGTVWDAQAQPIQLVDAAGQLTTTHLLIGRTRYALRYVQATNALTLTPERRHVWIPQSELDQSASPLITALVHPAQKRLSRPDLQTALAVTAAAALAVWLIASVASVSALSAVGLSGAGLIFAAFSHLPIPLLFTQAVLGATALIGGYLVAFGASLRLSKRSRLFGIGLLSISLTLFLYAEQIIPATLDTSPSSGLAIALAGAWLALLAPCASPRYGALPGLFWALFVAVALIAAAAGLRLALLETTQRYDQLLGRHLIALCLIGISVCIALAVAAQGGWAAGRRWLLPTRRRVVPAILWICVGLGFVGITAIGNETGFFGLFQPSEMAKSILCVVIASTVVRDLARRQMLSASEGILGLRRPAAAILMTLAILMASLLNYDMSPILVSGFALLLSFCAAAALHGQQLGQRRGSRRKNGLPVAQSPLPFTKWPSNVFGPLFRRAVLMRSSAWPIALLGLVIVSVGGLVWKLLANPSFRPGAGFDTYSFLLTPWKRIQSWWDMALGADPMIDFPETGLQLRRAREALLDAPCLQDRFLCPSEAPPTYLDGAIGRMLSVPAIQDDFAAVSLVHLVGIDGAVMYAALQAALIAVALAIAVGAIVQKASFSIGSKTLGLSALGVTAVVTAQIGLAWGNVLGLFPIMGQPMSFLSFGASHSIGVVLPFALLTVMAALCGPSAPRVEARLRTSLFKKRLTT